jgi:hypothetical protein
MNFLQESGSYGLISSISSPGDIMATDRDRHRIQKRTHIIKELFASMLFGFAIALDELAARPTTPP